MGLLITHSRRALMVLGMLFSLSSCDNDTTESVLADESSINLATTSLGSTLTGADGKTLYFFSLDANGNSGCNTLGCLANWVTYYADKATMKLGTGLDAANFGTITRADGRMQTTYKGWPLYYFKNDAKAGDVLGDKVGNVWFVAKPNYSIMLASSQLIGNDGKNYITTTSAAAYAEGNGSTIYMTDANGRTLYGFANDKKNKNNFTKADFSNDANFPLFQMTTVGEVPSTLNKSDFAIINVFGKSQLTYKGWPLYYYGADGTVRGSNKAVSFPRPGVWPIVNTTSPEAPAP